LSTLDTDMNPGEWIGVDLDGTLAYYTSSQGLTIGEPIEPMLSRVKAWIAQGIPVKIFTARASGRQWGSAGALEQMILVQDWLERNGLPRLEITCEKDYLMVELWDDRAVRVETNTGRRMA